MLNDMKRSVNTCGAIVTLGVSAVGSVLLMLGYLLLCHGRMALHCARSNLYGTSNESDGCSLYWIGNNV